jgi:hypothetical protein
MNKYIVINENTLGYLIEKSNPKSEFQYAGILHASILKGSTHNWLNGPVLIHSSDVVRNATLQDFADYQVCSKGHI